MHLFGGGMMGKWEFFNKFLINIDQIAICLNRNYQVLIIFHQISAQYLYIIGLDHKNLYLLVFNHNSHKNLIKT